MLNRDQIAHEYALQLVKKERYVSVSFTASTAFDLADAMIAEAEQRTDKERPAVLIDWISVDDRLPEDDEVVLVYLRNQDIMLDSHPYSFTEETTHWHPLPEPPHGVK